MAKARRRHLMNALEATIRDAMEDMGMLDPEEEVIEHIADAIEVHLIEEGWTRPGVSEEEPPPGTAEAEGDGTEMRDLSGRELPHPDEAT
jgi:hypothetical protein